MAKRLQDLLKQDTNNGWISMAELDALEAAQRGQPIGQIPGSFGSGQGSFQRSGGNRVDLTSQGWQDAETQQMMAPASNRPNQDVQLDYANPLDYMGAKGYRLKGDSTRALLNDGRTIDLAPQDTLREKAAQRQAQLQDLEIRGKQAEIAAKTGDDWHVADKSGVMINRKTGEIRKIGKGQGGMAEDQWKYDAGSDTWVAPPSAENPEGKVTIPASRANAAKSLGYVAEQFAPVIEKTPQGGFMGVSGLVGKVTNSQEARRFDNLKEQLSTELRTLFRIPGEGALSDREQAQYGVQLPDVRNDAETNKQILRDIQARAGIRIGGGQQQAQPAAVKDSGSTIDVGGQQMLVVGRNQDGSIKIRDPKTGRTGTVRQ